MTDGRARITTLVHNLDPSVEPIGRRKLPAACLPAKSVCYYLPGSIYMPSRLSALGQPVHTSSAATVGPSAKSHDAFDWKDALRWGAWPPPPSPPDPPSASGDRGRLAKRWSVVASAPRPRLPPPPVAAATATVLRNAALLPLLAHSSLGITGPATPRPSL